MSYSDYVWTFGQAAIVGLIALIGSIVLLRRSESFKKRGYFQFLTITFLNALASPFIYIWMTSYDISLADAVLMKTFYAGSWLVAEGYFLFAGMAVGGII